MTWPNIVEYDPNIGPSISSQYWHKVILNPGTNIQRTIPTIPAIDVKNKGISKGLTSELC